MADGRLRERGPLAPSTLGADGGRGSLDIANSGPDSPRRRELARHVAANFPPLAFHAFGRLPDGVGDEEIRQLSNKIEELAFSSTRDIGDPGMRKQAYYKAASKALLESVLDHCPPDADPTCMIELSPPHLEPLSASRPHVARPPMDPRFNAISPFADHTGEPRSPHRFTPPLSVLEEDNILRRRMASTGAEQHIYARTGSLPIEARQDMAATSAGYIHARESSLSYVRSSVGTSEATTDSSGRMQSIRRQMSLSLKQDSGLLPLSLGSLGRGSAVWGWLEACDPSLPHVLLQGPGLAIGRSREGFEARRHAISVAASKSGTLQDTSPSRRLAEVFAKALGFLEISDGRVSRLHCILQSDMAPNLPFMGRVSGPAIVEDQSANGTFVNGERLPKGERAAVQDGDKVSLVLSLSPMVEKSFVFRLGDPRQNPRMAATDWADTSSVAQFSVPLGAEKSNELQNGGQKKQLSSQSSRNGLKRMATSRYTTAESSEPGDMMCQICLGPLRSCLALAPCGHNFCAHCLSHHFASLLQSGQAINCPLRCSTPERVVINHTMRQLVEKEFPQHKHSRRHANVGNGPERRPSIVRGAAMQERNRAAELVPWHAFDRANMEREREGSPQRQESFRTAATELLETAELDSEADAADLETEGSNSSGDGEDDEGLTEMSSLCPLWDEMLPLDAGSLKSKQVEFALKDLQLNDLDRIMSSLEVLARLAWSDDEVRTAIAVNSGIECIVRLMKRWIEEPGLLCNACLCLMSLVRGEGPACEANQWQVAKAGGVEAVVGCMTSFPANSLVQLSALLCLIPLALDNPSLQAHVATLALPAVIVSLRQHLQHPDVQAKGLVVLGVLGQGEEAVHDAIRQQQLAVGATGRILESLKRWGEENEEVLWAVLFSLAVLVRDGANPYQPAIRAVAAAGIPPLLVTALNVYKSKAGDTVDEMIVTAGDYLLKTLEPASAQVLRERYGIAGLAMAPVVAASAFWAWRTANR